MKVVSCHLLDVTISLRINGDQQEDMTNGDNNKMGYFLYLLEKSDVFMK